MMMRLRAMGSCRLFGRAGRGEGIGRNGDSLSSAVEVMQLGWNRLSGLLLFLLAGLLWVSSVCTSQPSLYHYQST